jgi:NCAIR mutase (PurE)-related protein
MLSRIAKEDHVRVSYKPAKELVILEMVEYDLKQLAETCTLLMNAGRPMILTWAEGVAYAHTPLPFNTKDLLKERMNGKIFWASVMYASMPVFQPVIKVGVMDVPVVATPNPVLRQAASWLRKRLDGE